MSPRTLLDHFDLLAEAPGGVARLRELVLHLAVRGKLVPQDPADEPASELLKRIAKERARLVKEGKIRAGKPVPPVGAEEAPFEVPAGWEWCRLGEIAYVAMGNSPPGDTYNTRGEGVPLINGPVEFSAGAFGFTQKGKYTTAPSQLCGEGDLLVCVRGATTGRTNISAFSACIGRGIALVRAWEAQPYINLVMWWSGSRLLEAGKGTTFPSISYSDLAGISVALPPLAEQHRIVARVDELMALLDRLEAARGERDTTRLAARDSALAALRDAADASEVAAAWHRLEARMDDLFTAPEDVPPLRQAILQLAVRGRLVAQDPADEPASELLKRIAKERVLLVKERKIRAGKPLPPVGAEETPFEVPAGWEWCRLGALCVHENGDRSKNYPGKSHMVDDGIPFINAGHLQGKRVQMSDMNFISPERFALLRSGKIVPGDILYCLRGSLGKVGLIQDIPEGAIASSLVILRPQGHLTGHYLMDYFSSPLASMMIKLYDNGSAQPNLSAADLCKFLIPLPPLAEQHRMVARVEELNALCDRLESRLAAAREAQTALAAALLHQVTRPDFAA